LLLIAHQKTPEQILNQQIDGIEALTRLDANELQQLLSLFYNLRNDKDIAVDAVMDDTSQDMDMELPVKKDNQKRSVMCRKCRRASEKCVCESRQAEFNTKIGFSSDELSSMMREAMTLREEHQDFLDALD
jgi:hypothetical protein